MQVASTPLANGAPRWPDRLCLPLAFDPARLAADLAALDGDGWTPHFVRANYAGDWSALPLRHAAGETHPLRQIAANPDMTTFVDGPLLARLPYIREVVAAFRCPLRVVRLMRLMPGSSIREHCDPDLDADGGWARLHVPVATNPHVDFRLNGKRIDMSVGSAWYLRLSDPHAVDNRGTTPRVHLVIDCEVDAWLAGLLDRASRSALEVGPVTR